MADNIKMVSMTVMLPDEDKERLKELAVRIGMTQVRKGSRVPNVSAVVQMSIKRLFDDPESFAEWLKEQFENPSQE